MITHDLFIKLTCENQHIPSKVAIQADTEYKAELTIESSIADKKVLVNINPTKLKSILLLSDVDVFVETNNAEIPDDTISLKAGVPFLWFDGCGHPKPFDQPVSAFFVSNSNESDGTLKLCIAQDSE